MAAAVGRQAPVDDCYEAQCATTAVGAFGEAREWPLSSERQAAKGRGRVETSNLRDHAVSARSEAFRIATGALCTTARADLFDRGCFEIARQMPLAACPALYAIIACISGLIPMICMT